MRKKTNAGEQGKPELVISDPLTIIDTRDLYFCLEYQDVEICGQEIELTAKKFDIFALLILNPRHQTRKTGVTSATPVSPEISFTSLWNAAQSRQFLFYGSPKAAAIFFYISSEPQPARSPMRSPTFSRCACQPYSTVGTAGQPAKASSATCASFGMRILVKLVQPAKAPRPIFSTLCGSTTSVSCLQSRKAS
mgnify:CR=1 FL=1